MTKVKKNLNPFFTPYVNPKADRSGSTAKPPRTFGSNKSWAVKIQTGKEESSDIKFSNLPKPVLGLMTLSHTLKNALPELPPESINTNNTEPGPDSQGLDVKLEDNKSPSTLNPFASRKY